MGAAGSEEALDDVISAEAGVLRDVGQNAGECTNTQGIVDGQGDVVLATACGCEAQVAARLSGDLIAEDAQTPGKICSRDVAREPHTAMTSSRTKWSRMRRGRSCSSK